MDYQIRSLAGAVVAHLAELQGEDQFTRLLNCNEPDLRAEAQQLYMEINALKSRLERI